jgi:hypothetical protein
VNGDGTFSAAGGCVIAARSLASSVSTSPRCNRISTSSSRRSPVLVTLPANVTLPESARTTRGLSWSMLSWIRDGPFAGCVLASPMGATNGSMPGGG